MNAELEKRARERAWKLINEHRELFDSISKEFAVDIIAAALFAWGNERLEETAELAKHSNFVDRSLGTIEGQIAQAIRELKELK